MKRLILCFLLVTFTAISWAVPKPMESIENYNVTDKVPMWKGLGAKEADKEIIRYFKEQGRVFKQDTIVHSYPHCWRTGVPLIYRALKTWFLKIDEIFCMKGGRLPLASTA